MSEENSIQQDPELQDDYSATVFVPYIDTPSQPSHDSVPVQMAQQPGTLTEIAQLAATHQLGKVIREYKDDVPTALSVGISSSILGVLCCLPLIALIPLPEELVSLGGYAGFLRGLLWTSVLGFGFLSYGINHLNTAINSMGTNMLNHNPAIYLCSHGVMFIKGHQVQAIRWDEISAVQKIVSKDTFDTPQQYILYPQDDKDPLVLKRVSLGFTALGLQIEREVAHHLLPETCAAYHADQTLNFGAVNVTSQGLYLEEERKNLPWEKLGYVSESRGYLTIKEDGTLSTWATIEVSTMFNLRLLLALISQIKNDSYISGNSRRSLSYRPSTTTLLRQAEWQEYER